MEKERETQLVNKVSANLDLTISQLPLFVQNVVQEVEQVQAVVGWLSAVDKQQVALSTIVSYVNLPFPFSLVKKVATKLLIKYTVNELNRSRGHVWVEPPIISLDLGETK